jgi:uncharacterized cupin superfamily protein
MKVKAEEVFGHKNVTLYPKEFATRVMGRTKRKLGDHFGLTKFGVNHTTLEPGAQSALLHKHSKQEEFIFVLSGNPTLITSEGEIILNPGDCVGFIPAGPAHHLANKTDSDVTYIEIGDREEGDEAIYPADDLMARMVDKKWKFTRKDGSEY